MTAPGAKPGADWLLSTTQMIRTPTPYLVELALLVAIAVPTVLMCCALVITYDLHSARLESASANAETRREILIRVDAFRWKADTALEIASAMRFDLGSMINKLRVQVKQSSDESTKEATKQAKATTAAVTNAIDKTTESIQTASGELPAPKVEVEKPITVNVPPPVVLAPESQAEVPNIEVLPVQPKRRRWFRAIWPWSRLSDGR